MQVNNSALSLFDFVDNKAKSDEVFDHLVNSQRQSVSDGFTQFEQGLNADQYESTLKQLDNGDINLDRETINRYFSFNLSRLDEQVSSLQRNFDLDSNTVIKIEDNTLSLQTEEGVEPDERLQLYLNKNKQLQDLVSQTSKLSKFVEWADAKEQAAEFQTQGMDEGKLTEFLKDARRVVNEPDYLSIRNRSLDLHSVGHTKHVISKYVEEPVTR